MAESFDFDDQGILEDFFEEEEPCTHVDEDEVFLGGFEDSVELREKRKPIKEILQSLSPKSTHSCPIEWSLNHRCLECAFRANRRRPPHLPIIKIDENFLQPPSTSPLLTLQSLCATRDSGYDPSPTSAYSFTFEEEFDSSKASDVVDVGEVEEIQLSGTTPPIKIPSSTGARSKTTVNHITKEEKKAPIIVIDGDSTPEVDRFFKSSESSTQDIFVTKGADFKANDCSFSEFRCETSLAKVEEESADQLSDIRLKPFRKRSRSSPDILSEPRAPRLPLIYRDDDDRMYSPGVGRHLQDPVAKTGASASPHSRNFSLPATTPDGRPLFLSTPSPAASRASREGLIDLAEEDPDGSAGHKRRVLVLALPDLVVDVERRHKQNQESSSSYSPTSTASAGSPPQFKFPSGGPSGSGENFDRQASTTSQSSSGSSPVAARKRSVIPKTRPAWRRPRALSCDVTMEVEVGIELRRIADDFQRHEQNEEEAKQGLWVSLRNSFRRRFSFTADRTSPVLRPRSRSPESPCRDCSPMVSSPSISSRGEHSPRDCSTRINSPRDRSPRIFSPRVRSPRINSPREDLPRISLPMGSSSLGISPQRNSPRTSSPIANSSRTSSPIPNSPRTSSPISNSQRTRSPRVSYPGASSPRVISPDRGYSHIPQSTQGSLYESLMREHVAQQMRSPHS